MNDKFKIGEFFGKIKKFLLSKNDTVLVNFVVQLTVSLIVALFCSNVAANKIINRVNGIVINGNDNTSQMVDNSGEILGDIYNNGTGDYYDYSNSSITYNITGYPIELFEKECLQEPAHALMPQSKEIATYVIENHLVDVPIMICEYDGGTLFFSGNLDSNNRWNGKCLINYVKDNILIAAVQEEYVSGERINYSSLTFSGDECFISERIVNGDINEGKTWKYVKKNKYYIDTNAIEKKQLVNPEQYRLHIDTPLISYYSGNTSNGLYNDDTGKAYFVSYYEDGCVKTLYHGKFREGKFDDDSGNAWDICMERDNNTYYMYSKGIFVSGKIEDAKEFENPLTLDTFNSLLENYSDLIDQLKWDSKLYDGFKNFK